MAPKPLRGYTRVPGSARQYRTPSGAIISRYEYDNRRLRAAGSPFKNRYEAEKFRASKDWRTWSYKVRASGKRASIFDADLAGAVKRVGEVRAGMPQGEPDPDELTAPDGPLAILLVAIGARDPDWNWPVGETPKGMSA
jgi:hypothetical protein